jgi:antitoxin component YwqK of YwqJK toxin-antitoxin module
MLNRRSFLKSVPTPLLGFFGLNVVSAGFSEESDEITHTISRNGLIHTWRNKYGEYHRTDGPAVIRYYQDGEIRSEEYYVNGQSHRMDGPAYISYYNNGQIKYEEYSINNQRHRVDGPAYIGYFKDGSTDCEQYWINGKQHRTDGPAWIEYYPDGKISYEQYYINGKKINKRIIGEKNLEL